MNLYAYANIENLEDLMKINNIEVPRLRGLCLMKDEEPYSPEELDTIKKYSTFYVLRDLLTASPAWTNSGAYVFDTSSDRRIDRYLIKDKDQNYVGIRWNKIHGKHRKRLKFEIKKKMRRIDERYSLWNKYAGQDNILYIHARIGGDNWELYGGNEISKQSWFLEKVDDHFDRTYCDIYAKINN